MKFCSNCGFELEQDVRFCGNCGSQLVEAESLGHPHMGSSPIYLGEMPSVSFADAIKIAFSKYADFRGRARRSEYWWFFLFVQLVTQLPGIILPGVGSIVSLVAFLVTFIPSLSVTARRLHDIGRTGWWQLSWFLLGFLSAVMVIIGSLGAIVVFFDEFAIDNGLEQFDHGFEAFVGIGVLGLLISLATLLWWIIWLVKKGDLGSNEYGSDPRSR